MKFRVPSKPLTDISLAVSRVINIKTSLQILNDFMFEIKDDCLTIYAGDGENYLMGRLTVENLEDNKSGRICLQAKNFVELMKAMPEQDLEFIINEENFEIRIELSNGHYTFMGEDATLFPRPKEIKEMDGVNPDDILEVRMTGSKLNRGLDMTMFAAATDTARPQMHGVCLDFTEDGLTYVATDTHKLSCFKDQSVHGDKPGMFILPLKTATVFRSVFLDDEEVTITLIPDKGVRFVSQTFTFDSRLVKGRFPDYTRVIPNLDQNKFCLTADRSIFTNACKRVSIFCTENGLIKFKMTPEELTIKTADVSYNSMGMETLPCEFDGTELTIGFKDAYLNEVLAILWDEKIIVHLSDASRPAIFVPEKNHPESELTVLLMPMNMNDF